MKSARIEYFGLLLLFSKSREVFRVGKVGRVGVGTRSVRVAVRTARCISVRSTILTTAVSLSSYTRNVRSSRRTRVEIVTHVVHRGAVAAAVAAHRICIHRSAPTWVIVVD